MIMGSDPFGEVYLVVHYVRVNGIAIPRCAVRASCTSIVNEPVNETSIQGRGLRAGLAM